MSVGHFRFVSSQGLLSEFDPVLWVHQAFRFAVATFGALVLLVTRFPLPTVGTEVTDINSIIYKLGANCQLLTVYMHPLLESLVSFTVVALDPSLIVHRLGTTGVEHKTERTVLFVPVSFLAFSA
jgi:hypothetical protein